MNTMNTKFYWRNLVLFNRRKVIYNIKESVNDS